MNLALFFFFDTKKNLSSKTFDCLLPSPGDEGCHSFQSRVSSQEIPEGLLTNVHLYYNFQHSKSCKCELLSNQAHAATLVDKTIPIIGICWSKVFSAMPFLSICTGYLLQMLFQENISVSSPARH